MCKAIIPQVSILEMFFFIQKCIRYECTLLYEALQDQSTAVPITIHMALW